MKKNGVVEIARRFGVAPSTVSRAIHGSGRISESLKKAIVEYVRALGYQPPSPRRNIIGVAFSLFGAKGYCPELLLAFRNATAKESLRLELITPESLGHLDFRTYRGIATFLMSKAQMRDLCERVSCPVVAINEPPEAKLSNYAVISDDVAGVAAAGNLLLRAGHRKIAMLLCERERSFNNINRQRGYEEFCRQNRIKPAYFATDSQEECILPALAEIKRARYEGLILHCGLDPFYLLHKAGLDVPSALSVVLLHDRIPRERDHFFHMVVQDYERIAESTLQIMDNVLKDAAPRSAVYLPYRAYYGHSIKEE